MTPWTEKPGKLQSMGFSRQEYCSGLPFPSPEDLPNPGIEPRSPALQADSLPTELQRKPTLPVEDTKERFPFFSPDCLLLTQALYWQYDCVQSLRERQSQKGPRGHFFCRLQWGSQELGLASPLWTQTFVQTFIQSLSCFLRPEFIQDIQFHCRSILQVKMACLNWPFIILERLIGFNSDQGEILSQRGIIVVRTMPILVLGMKIIA